MTAAPIDTPEIDQEAGKRPAPYIRPVLHVQTALAVLGQTATVTLGDDALMTVDFTAFRLERHRISGRIVLAAGKVLRSDLYETGDPVLLLPWEIQVALQEQVVDNISDVLDQVRRVHLVQAAALAPAPDGRPTFLTVARQTPELLEERP